MSVAKVIEVSASSTAYRVNMQVTFVLGVWAAEGIFPMPIIEV